MRNIKLKRAMLMLTLLVMTLSAVTGGTIAWFTDSVKSADNVIAAGNLDVTLEWADGKNDPTTTSWTDASTGAIFDYELWEPGYAEVRHVKIANKGSLAFKYNVTIEAEGEVSKLADVIDVYYADPAVQVENRTQLSDDDKLDTLMNVLANMGETGFGQLKAGESDVITIALKMQESAGNEYQNLAIGTDFSIKLVATQLTSESDSFGDQYDAGAKLPNEATYVYNEDELNAVLAEGGLARFGQDIEVTRTVKMLNGGVIDGNGKMLYPASGTGSGFVMIDTNGGTIKNVTIKDPNAVWFDSKYAIGSNQYASTKLTEDIIIDNVDIENFKFSIDLDANGFDVNVSNSEITNFVQVANTNTTQTGVTQFENCHLMSDDTSKTMNSSQQAVLFLMGNMVFTNCHLEETVNFYLDSPRFSGEVHFNNSTYGNNGVENRPIDSFGFITYWMPAFGVYGYAGTFGATKPAQTHFDWYINSELVWDATAI